MKAISNLKHFPAFFFLPAHVEDENCSILCVCHVDAVPAFIQMS